MNSEANAVGLRVHAAGNSQTMELTSDHPFWALKNGHLSDSPPMDADSGTQSPSLPGRESNS